MARYWCERCKLESNTLSEPHLCADVQKRLTRRERQVDAVYDLLEAGAPELEALARKIVAKLAQMGVGDD